MRNRFWLFVAVGKAALITCVCALVVGVLSFRIAVTHVEQEILGAVIAIIPSGIAAWWMFRKLRAHCTRREARAVALTFGVFTPVSLGVALVLAQIPGGYAEALLGGPFALVGAFAGTVVMTTLLSFLACLLALSVTRRIESFEQPQ
jgi:hypothetical protein